MRRMISAAQLKDAVRAKNDVLDVKTPRDEISYVGEFLESLLRQCPPFDPLVSATPRNRVDVK